MSLLVLSVVTYFVNTRMYRGDYPELARVKGRVTLDGKPPPAGLIVCFLPVKGRFATGLTDQEGYYDLDYRDIKGTIPGQNKIYLTWPTGHTNTVPIPADFAEGNKTLALDVKLGMNKFDIEMKSKK